MNSNQTITKDRPKTKTKGYRDSFLGDWNPEGYIFRKLETFTLIKYKRFLKTHEYRLLQQISNSVKEIIKGKIPLDSDFLPKGFEDEEAKHLNNREFLKYVVYRYKYNLYPKLKLLDDYPPCVQIEPTSMCNFRCVMC